MEKITLKDARIRAGYSLRDLVAQSKAHAKTTGRKGISLKTAHFIETGKRKTVRPSTVKILEETLGLAPGSLDFTPQK